jgi:hypothetical protein
MKTNQFVKIIFSFGLFILLNLYSIGQLTPQQLDSISDVELQTLKNRLLQTKGG